MLKIGFLGGGNMARAIVAGLVSSGAHQESNLLLRFILTP